MKNTIDTMTIGQTAHFEKTITDADVCMFAGVSGDLNPVHINDVEAAKTMFGQRIVHGALTASLTSTVLGMKLPAEGTIFLSQESKYKAPVFIGDTLKATVEVIDLNEEKNIATFKTFTTNQKGKVVLEGVAKVMPPKA